MRDIIGDPFLAKPTVDPSWLSWNDEAIPKLAKTIYECRHFGLMPILGDALEEAGAIDEGILRHCRSEADHVRGCWVIDALLGKS